MENYLDYDNTSMNNGAVLYIAGILKYIMASADKAEVGGICIHSDRINDSMCNKSSISLH